MPRAAQPPAPPLQHYRARRDFAQTPEPAPDPDPDTGAAVPAEAGLRFVVQEHHARRLHHDFRLELDGVLLSWAVPKGPSLDPAHKRMAVRTEDHPLAYAGFEGRIPAGQYGAGDVIVWDRGRWQPLGDPRAGLARGRLGFVLHGHKLRGRWELVRLHDPAERQEHWLLVKQRDAEARPGSDVLQDLPGSVLDAGEAPGAVADRIAAGMAPGPAASPAGAVPAPLPAQLGPQLALPASRLPGQGRWVFEDKLDGYRLLARIDGGVPRLFTRGGHDWTGRLPHLATALAALGLDSAWLDGEIVVRGPDGQADFHRLQTAFDRGGARATQAVEYVLFDLPYFEGHDLRGAPLAARRHLLCQLPHALGRAPLRFSAALGHGGAVLARQLLQAACAAGREGLLAKRDDSPYRSARSPAWLKLKCQQRQEFVLAGYTPRSDDARAVGSLLLAVHDDHDALRAAGSVGTGWSQADARQLLRRLRPLRADRSPLQAGPPTASASVPTHWLCPSQVAEVAFGAWTPAGQVRHAVFVALRDDKPATAVVRERPLPAQALAATGTAAAAAPAARPPRQAQLSHPDRVIDAASGTTKAQLAQYLDAVHPLLLAELRGRPVALLRAPGGVAGPQFFQKHAGDAPIPGVQDLPATVWPGHAPLLALGSRAALQGAAQMNVLEFHPWTARSRLPAKPDRLVFDLDPGEGVAWAQVQEGAQLVRALLDGLGLQSWLKTSGGKGLHLVVPLAARWPHAVVKGFSKAVVQHLARTIPQRFVARSGPANRRGRIFVDYLRNGEGATTAAAWSPRARPGLGVSVPLLWDELADVTGAAQWTVADAAARLDGPAARHWATMAQCRQSLRGPMQALGHDPGPDAG